MNQFIFFVGLSLASFIGGYGINHFFKLSDIFSLKIMSSINNAVSEKPVTQLNKEFDPASTQDPKSSKTNLASNEEAFAARLPRGVYIAPHPSLHKEDLVLDAPDFFSPLEEIISSPRANDLQPKSVNPLVSSEYLNEVKNFRKPKGPLPAWRRYALAIVPKKGIPAIAVVIDDMGVDLRRSARVINFPGPLTLSFLTYAKFLNEQGDKARANGHELMLHVAMEPSGSKVDPGPNVLLVQHSAGETLKRLRWGLDRFKGFVGINNHMGSKFTANFASMQVVINELKLRGLMFLDSRTSGRSVGGKLARLANVPYAERNVFLDHNNDILKIKLQLQKVEKISRERGSAVAIGHPRDATLKVLEVWLSSLSAKGFQLVPISALARISKQKV